MSLTHEELVQSCEQITQARAARPLLAAEMLPSAINLAQTLTEELLALGLRGPFYAFGPELAEEPRVYRIGHAKWKEGRVPGRRLQRSVPVMVRDLSGGMGMNLALLWDPRQPSREWGEELDCPTFGLASNDMWGGVSLASSQVLALFALDAEEILASVTKRELRQTELLDQGLLAADKLLGLRTGD